jgi:hypothetical protein
MVFFWLFIKHRVIMWSMLRRINMNVDSYTCELRLWKRDKTLQHLFLQCKFAKACWDSIGIQLPKSLHRLRVAQILKNRIVEPFRWSHSSDDLSHMDYKEWLNIQQYGSYSGQMQGKVYAGVHSVVTQSEEEILAKNLRMDTNYPIVPLYIFSFVYFSFFFIVRLLLPFI